MPPTKSPVDRDSVIETFAAHLSRPKVEFYQRYGFDLVMGKREGIFFEDLDGRRLINAHCNGGVFNMGHRHPALVSALKQALDSLDIGNHHLISTYRAQLAQRLTASIPGDIDHLVFASSGGEAIDMAIKMARGFTQRPRILSAQGGYHGHTGLAMATGDPRYRDPFGPSIPGFQQVPFLDLDALEQALDSSVAAVILETIPATLGIVVPTAAYLQGVRRLCDRYGCLLILDEIQSGLGRTGKMWAFEHFDISPDIVVTGKGLSGGLYPIAATCFRGSMERLFEADPFVHISTFGGAELGCVVSLALLDILESTGFLQHITETGEQINAALSEFSSRYSEVLVGIRQLGMMIGLVFARPGLGVLFSRVLLDHGIFAVYSNNDKRVTQFLLPLIIQPHEVQDVLERLRLSLEAIQQPEMREMAALIETL